MPIKAGLRNFLGQGVQVEREGAKQHFVVLSDRPSQHHV